MVGQGRTGSGRSGSTRIWVLHMETMFFFVLWTMCLKSILSETCVVASYICDGRRRLSTASSLRFAQRLSLLNVIHQLYYFPSMFLCDDAGASFSAKLRTSCRRQMRLSILRMQNSFTYFFILIFHTNPPPFPRHPPRSHFPFIIALTYGLFALLTFT